MPQLIKKPGLVAAALLLVLAVWEIASLLHTHAAAPADADWQAARATVLADHRPGDLIVFAPAWVDPVGRKWLGDLLSVDDAARMDEARYGRVWELSIRGAAFPGLTGTVALDQTHGAVRVRCFERPAAQVLWDLRSRDTLLEIDYAPRNCVPVAVPGTLDAGLVPTGTTLAVRAGLADFRDRRDNRSFARVRVLVDGTEIAQASIGSESGWVPLDGKTQPGEHRVVIEAAVDPARGGPPARLSLCVAAEARQ